MIKKAIVVVAVLAGLFLLGFLPRRAQQKRLEQRAHESATADSVPLVTVFQVHRASNEAELMLPGTLQPNHEAAVYARSSGYVRRWYTDMGQHVHAGELLADIDAPDLDQQLAQARQNMVNAQATRQLDSADLERWKVLYRDSSVTKEELEQHQSSFQSADASVSAAQANVRRLEALVSYEKVTAPFDGVITARNVEEGVFVTPAGTVTTPQAAGAGGNTLVGQAEGSELFRIARTDTIRVYLGVPQSYAPEVRVGQPATLMVEELPGQTFQGRVARTANSVDAASRTLLTEVDVVNPKGVLIPGIYAQVHFHFERPSPPILMPSTALIFRTSAPQAAVVGSDSVARFRNITIGRDYGTVMEVLAGLDDNDLIVEQPLDNLRNGAHIRGKLDSASQSAPVPTDRPQSQSVRPVGAQPVKQTRPPSAGGYHPPPEVIEGFPGSAGGGYAPTSSPAQ